MKLPGAAGQPPVRRVRVIEDGEGGTSDICGEGYRLGPTRALVHEVGENGDCASGGVESLN